MKNHSQLQQQSTKNSGYILIFSIIIIASVMTVIVIRGALTSTTNLSKNDTEVSSQKIKIYTEGCLEEGLIQMNRDVDYSGGTYSIGGGDCTIAVSGSDNTRTITASTNINEFYHELNANVTLEPFAITSWDEE
ncbi:hypothetical protein HN958_01285 [Candidatus Falkowbacteria bacterium]|nr:hypothetical protein [Candidatus Falkowbacteria bacterium]MBT7007118.1 hypothetical protein [Candidatus Falkowbacteria bacterium]